MNLPLHLVDILLLVYLLFSVGHGIKRGLFSEIQFFIRAILSLSVAWYYFPALGTFVALHTRLTHEPSAQLFAFAVLAAGTYIAFCLLALLISLWVEFKPKRAKERLGGAILGLVRGIVILGVVVVAISLGGTSYIKEKVIMDSRIGSTLDYYLTPAYLNLAQDNPGLRLPYPEQGWETPGEADEQR